MNYPLLLLGLALSSVAGISQDSLHLMIVTGGHNFDRPAFFDMFDDMDRVTYEEIKQPLANERIEAGAVAKFDLLVFYDMYDSITPGQQQAYLQLVDQRKPLLFLHHSIVSYQEWPDFADLLGGKYLRDGPHKSDYKHDETIEVKIVDGHHPITKGMDDFTIIDETYKNCEIKPTVVPLLTTEHPLSMPILAWVNPYRGHDIVYLQGGHDAMAYTDPNFRKLLSQAIHWLVDR